MDLNSIEISGIEQYKNIVEYNFYLLKLQGILKNNVKIELYLKIIKKGEVKKSVFCYYSLLYNDFKKENINSRVRIIEKESNLIKNTVIICLDNEKIDNKLEINLFNLERMIQENSEIEIRNCEKQIDSNDILLVGIKYL